MLRMRVPTVPGFSLLELAIVIGLLGTIAALTIGLSSNAIERSRMSSVEETVVQNIRRAQTLARNNVSGSAWGMYLCAPSDCTETNPPAAIIFKRSSYGTLNSVEDRVSSIGSNVSFSGSLYNRMIVGKTGLIFAQLTGAPNVSGTLIMNTQNTTQKILVNEKGAIER